MQKLALFTLVLLSLVFNTLEPLRAEAPQSQKAKIFTDGAMVFNKPTPNGDVLAYLPAGKTYWISKKKVGKFFKIRIAPKAFGWILGSDVRTAAQLKILRKKELEQDAREDADEITKIVSEEEKDEEIYFTRYAGPILATVDFKEDTFAGEKTEDLLMFGVKVSGPKVLINGPTLTSLDLLLHPGAPTYYESLTNQKATGWLILADFGITAPFYGGSNYMFYYTLGPLVRWSQFNIKAGNAPLSLQDIHLGATIELGAALQVGPLSLRGEYRYFWEVTKYRALNFAIQMKF